MPISRLNDATAASPVTTTSALPIPHSTSTITSFVSSSLLPSVAPAVSTTSFSSQTLPLSNSAKSAFLSQQLILDNQISDQSVTPISVIPDQQVDPILTTNTTITRVPASASITSSTTTVTTSSRDNQQESVVVAEAVTAIQQTLPTTPTNNTNNNSNVNGKTELITTPNGTVVVKGTCNSDSSRRRRTRCKKCDSCVRSDCGECHFCKDMKKFGGPGRMKQSCITRQCMTPVLPHTACCTICGRDGWEKLAATGVAALDGNQSSLMECSQCWEIVHPVCLKEKHPHLSLDSGKRDDLPNSWECPKCVAATKTQAKARSPMIAKIIAPGANANHQELQSTPASHKHPLAANNNCMIIKQIKQPDSTADGAVKDELLRFDDEISIKIASTDKLQNSSSTGPVNSSSSPAVASVKKQSSSKKIRPSHPLTPIPTLALQALAKQEPKDDDDAAVKKILKVGTATGNGCKKASPPVPQKRRKKTGESVKDRLLRIFKTLKKNSGPPCAAVRTVSLTSTRPSVACSVKVSKNKTATPVPVPGLLPNGSSTIASTTNNANGTQSNKTVVCTNSHKTIPQANPAFEEETDDETEEEVEEDLEEDNITMEKTESDISLSVVSSPVDGLPKEKTSPKIGVHGKPLINPLYVVRPAPIPQDCIDSDIGDDEEDEDENENDDSSEDEDERRKKRIIRAHFKRFRRPLPSNLALERDVIFPALRYLSRNEILVCSQVCKPWNAWTTDPSLWNTLSASGKRITPAVLVSIVRRQPLELDLSWSKISKKQLSWLLPRLPQLKLLSLSGCTATAASALASFSTPLLTSLDLSWIDAFDDDLMRELTSSPIHQRPGFSETKTRLRSLRDVNLAGSEITDSSTKLLAMHLPNLTRIDLSNCNRLTDVGVSNLIGTAAETKLSSLMMYGCDRLTDQCFESLKKCSNLSRLDLRNCDRITIAAFTKFFRLQSTKQHRLTQAQNKLMCLKK